MIGIVARIRLKLGHEAIFLEAAKEYIAAVRRHEADALFYELFSVPGDAQEYVIFEVYRSMDALEAHQKAHHFRVAYAKSRSAFDGLPVMEFFNSVWGRPVVH